MQVPKKLFFTNNIITKDINIYLNPIKFSFNIGKELFNYSFTKKRFVGYVIHFSKMVDILSKNGIDYFATLIKEKSSFYYGMYKFVINCIDYIKFIETIRNISNKSKFEILYESTDYLNNTRYIKNFLSNNIKSIINPLGFYFVTNICSRSVYDEQEYIDIFLSGNSISINGKINHSNQLVEIIKNITIKNIAREMKIGEYFNLSNDLNIPPDNNKINNFLNYALEYFPDLYIKYIYIGYNYHN